jgi:flagellar protein FlaJ
MVATLLTVLVLQGVAPTSLEGMFSNVIFGTFIWIYLPSYLIFIPLMIFYEWNQVDKRGVVGHMSDTLRKLANANDTGQTLFEAMSTISETSNSKLAQEFDIVYAKVEYGMTLQEALIEFNNKYDIPRLARMIKVITTASEASNQITKVLTTAAESSENQDDIVRERKSRARMQVAIIIMTYMTLLAVMAILQTQFIEVMTGLVEQANQGSGGGGGGAGGAQGGQFAVNLNPDRLSMLFFHAVTIQAIMSGFISGYMRNAKILSGLKFVIVLQTISLVVWILVV